MPATMSAGQTIRCTITSTPRNQDAKDTIERLMRRDPDIKRGLARAQKLRGKRLNVYIRGNRRWSSREKSARIARFEDGASWAMTFTHDIGPDLASVEQYLKIDNA